MSLAGSFLIAKPTLNDPNFSQTVVLLLAHTADGAFGLVVNRPVEVEGLPFAVFAGGPCETKGLMMLHGHAEWAEACLEPAAGQVAQGIFLGDASCVSRVSDATEGEKLRYRMFSGYAGWGPDQLEREMAAGAWAVVAANAQLLFDTPAEELWFRLVPPTIPEPSLN